MPAGTAVATPASQVVATVGQWIARVRLTIPSGHNGFTGWQLQLAGTVVVPYSGSSFVIGSDTELVFDVNRWANEGQLVMLGYNTGVWPHAFHVLFDAYPTEPSLPVSAAIDTSSTAVADTTAAVAGLEQLAPDTGDTTDATAATDLPDLDTTGLEPDLPLEPVDVESFAPSPAAGSSPVPVPAHPVNRAELTHAAKAARTPQTAASGAGHRSPVRTAVRQAPAGTPPAKAKPAERPPARHTPPKDKRK